MKHPKNHASKERTLVIIKPDGVQRTLIGEIIKRYERAGLKLVGVKMVVPTEEHVEAVYRNLERKHKTTGYLRKQPILNYFGHL